MSHRVRSTALPPGSERVAAWARRHGFQYQPRPDPAWFSAWEPFDTMVSASAYYNAVTWSMAPGQSTLAEPWLAPLDSEPLERTVLVFVSHPGFLGRVALRGGAHFNTRVAYLEGPPVPAVELGDPGWDTRWVTLAASSSEAQARLPWAVRELLSRWSFSGHLELRPGRLIVHFAGTRPEPDHLERLLPPVAELTAALTRR
jgi:hypothetical protein